MFLPNKYTMTYLKLMNRAKSRIIPDEYCEKHHIIPKCMGGSNKKENLVVLTGREHFIAHLLLIKMTESGDKAKMVYAANLMLINRKDQNRYLPNSRMFSKLREMASIQRGNMHRGKVLSAETKAKISKAKMGLPSPRKGKPANYSPEVLEKISKAHRGKTISAEHIAAVVAANTGSKHSEETKAKMRAAAKLRGPLPPVSDETRAKQSAAQKGKPKPQPKMPCPNCGELMLKITYIRWHQPKCFTSGI